MKKLVVFDSHPVQYRVPLWREMEKEAPGALHVVYASDCSVRGHSDKGFGQNVSWDDPMLEGYQHSVLNCEKGVPLSGPDSLTGEGVAEKMEELKPEVVLLTGLNYKFDRVAYREARKRKIPVWLRCETQDEAVIRSKLKSILRSFIYRFAYRGLSKAFYIGELNKQHYIRHGVANDKLCPARYCTVDRFSGYTKEQKFALKSAAKQKAGIAEDALVIGFSGKFIPKKDPGILFRMVQQLPVQVRQKTHIYFIGSGELQNHLHDLARQVEEEDGVKTFFAGFVNQSELAAHYLAMDILVLPSRRMGETWGLVANESMQGGCAAVVSDAVGCSADFSAWERFRVFKEKDEKDLAAKINELSNYTINFDWAAGNLKAYSIESAAGALLKELKK
ncbi:MAG: glycosyltransferase [Chitinophagaceae bacterium]